MEVDGSDDFPDFKECPGVSGKSIPEMEKSSLHPLHPFAVIGPVRGCITRDVFA